VVVLHVQGIGGIRVSGRKPSVPRTWIASAECPIMRIKQTGGMQGVKRTSGGDRRKKLEIAPSNHTLINPVKD